MTVRLSCQFDVGVPSVTADYTKFTASSGRRTLSPSEPKTPCAFFTHSWQAERGRAKSVSISFKFAESVSSEQACLTSGIGGILQGSERSKLYLRGLQSNKTCHLCFFKCSIILLIQAPLILTTHHNWE